MLCLKVRAPGRGALTPSSIHPSLCNPKCCRIGLGVEVRVLHLKAGLLLGLGFGGWHSRWGAILEGQGSGLLADRGAPSGEGEGYNIVKALALADLAQHANNVQSPKSHHSRLARPRQHRGGGFSRG